MTGRDARQLRDREGNILQKQMYDAARDLFQSYTPEHEDAVSMGMVMGCTRAFAIGYNPDIDIATTPEDCWGGSGLFNFPAPGGVAMQIRSTDANDTAAGTGMRTVSLSLLDPNYVAMTGVSAIPLNGTTPVLISGFNAALIQASNGLRGITAGSAGTNIGQIILEAVGAPGGTLYGTILPGIGVANQAPFTVPAGQTLFIPQLLLNVNSPSGLVNFFAQMRTKFKFFTVGGDGCVIQPLVLGNTNGSPYNHISKPPIVVPEKTQFSLPVTVVSDNNTVVTAGWNGWMRSNTVNSS